MVKSLISALIALSILLFGSYLEQRYVNETFTEFKELMVVVYKKVENDEAVKDDVLSAQTYWIEKKQTLHVFIPHNEIKEVDLWLSESATLVRDQEWKDAISKIEVLTELTEQIPKTFKLSWENLL